MRRSLRLPITLAVIMIILDIALLVGWVVATIYAAQLDRGWPSFFWTLLPLGAVFLSLVLAGIIVYLVLSVKLINLNQRQSNFIDAVTHELKSPLASLKLHLQTLQRLKIPPEEQTLFFENMQNDVNRLDGLISQVLMVSVLESTPHPGAKSEAVSLRKLVDDCVRSAVIRYSVPQEKISVHLPNYYVYGKRFAIELILRNLIDNAVKYADATAPQIHVVSRKTRNGWVVIRVADNGPGIPAHLRRKIFLRFFRIGDELERKKTGTGLGLYIVKILIRQARGKLKISDRIHRSGTNFDIILPGKLFDPPDMK